MPEIVQRYGRLTLIEVKSERAADGHLMGRWLCDCGREATIALSRVKCGKTKSCGCLASEVSSEKARKHGMRGTPEYNSWIAMVRRCTSPKSKDYARYGAKGITVCDEWRNSFEEFYKYVGPRPSNTTLDRIIPENGYRPGNVRWATPTEQARNRRDVVMVRTALGTMALVDYAARLGITAGAAHQRLMRGKLEGVARV